MGWFVRERRGPSWKDQTLESISAPPLPLVLFFGLFMMLMGITAYSQFMERIERHKMGFRFALFLMPLAGILVVNMMMLRHRWWRYVLGVRHPVYETVSEEGSGSPWGLLLVLGLLVVMVYYQSSFQSAWFRSF